MSNYIAKDGFINVEEFVALARDIDKMATKEGLKPAELYFTAKVVPKYDLTKAKAGGDLFTKKRAQVIKIKKRMPASGSRMRMMVVLRNYKGLEEYSDYWKDFQLALKAIAVHNKIAEKTVASIKSAAAKKRDTLNKAFDKALDAFEKVLAEAGIDEDNIAIGQSMMGKTMIVKLPGNHYVSIGKADAEKFDKAANPQPAKAAFGRKPAAKAAPSKATPKTSAKAPAKAVSRVGAKKPVVAKKVGARRPGVR